MGVAAAGDLHGQPPVGPRGAADGPEREAAAGPLRPPRSDEGRRLQGQVLHVELVGPARGRHLRGDEELLDVQGLDGEVAGAQGLAEVGGQLHGVRPRGREPDLGPADPGLGEAELALQERRQGDLGLDEPGVEGRPVRIGPEMEAVDAQPRRRQEADLDPPVCPGRDAEGAGERPVDQRAVGLPIDEGRDGERRHENQDDGARQRGQKITQWSRSALMSARGCPDAVPRAPRASRHGHSTIRRAGRQRRSLRSRPCASGAAVAPAPPAGPDSAAPPARDPGAAAGPDSGLRCAAPA